MSVIDLSIKTKILKWLNIVNTLFLITLSVIMVILQIIIQVSNQFYKSFLYEFRLTIVCSSFFIIILTVISLILNQQYQKNIELDTFSKKSFKNIINEVRTEKKETSIQNSRNELRIGLKIILYVTICICIYWTVVSKNVYVFITSVSILLIAYIYADYIPHAMHYSKYYDSLFTEDFKKAQSVRGLAEIYLDEYNKTEGEFYKLTPEDFTNYSEKTHCEPQDAVIKNILYMWADSIQSPIMVYGIIILFFNIIFIIPNVSDDIINNILVDLGIYISPVSSAIVLLLNIYLSYINVSTIYSYQTKCVLLKKIHTAFKSSDYKERLEAYNDLKEKDTKKFELLRARGVFTFCSTCMDDNRKLNEIDLKYRMLFCHRYDANRSRFWSTFGLGFLAIISALLNWKINLVLSLIIISSCVLFSLLFYFIWLPNLGKKRISKQCERLIEDR